MSDLPDSFTDEQALTEHLFLWSDLQEQIQAHSADLGIRQAYSLQESDKVVLCSLPTRGGYLLQLWGLPTKAELVGQVSLFYQDTNGAEVGVYEVQSDNLVYTGDGMRKSLFTRDDIAALRADVTEAIWDPNASQLVANTRIIVDPRLRYRS